MRELGWFVIFLAASAGTMALILTGVLRGRRAVWAWVLVCGVMICELSRADRRGCAISITGRSLRTVKTIPNEIVKFLRQEPWEHRVAAKLVPNGGGYPLCDASFPVLGQVCHWWLENDFPYNDIQTVDLDQIAAPAGAGNQRVCGFCAEISPGKQRNFRQLDLSPPVRLWKLCTTRDT